MARVNGQSLYYFKTGITEEYGEDVWQKVIGGTGKEVQGIFSRTVLASQFYDQSAEREVVDSFKRVMGNDELVRLAEHDAEKQLKGLFGFVAKFMTEKRLLSRMQVMWDKDYDQGKIRLADSEGNSYRVRVSDFPYDESMIIYHMNYFRRLAEIVTGKPFSCTYEKGKEAVDFIFENRQSSA